MVSDEIIRKTLVQTPLVIGIERYSGKENPLNRNVRASSILA